MKGMQVHLKQMMAIKIEERVTNLAAHPLQADATKSEASSFPWP